MAQDPKEKEDAENQGFKVNDRRRFASDGTARSEAPEPEPPGEPASESASQAKAEEATEAKFPPHEGSEGSGLPPPDFSSLLLSLAANAQAALGIAPDPISGKLEKNLAQAKSVIDLLGVLEEKTKGNLSQEEARLLEALLYELRMRYVENQKQGK